MHTAYVIAFLLLTASAVLAATEKAWTFALLAAGLACYVLPVAFQLTN